MVGKAIISYGMDFNNIPSDDLKALVLAQPKPLAVVPPKPLVIVPPKHVAIVPSVMSKPTTYKNHLILVLQGDCCKELLMGSRWQSPRVLHFFNPGRMSGSCRTKLTRTKN